MHCRHEFIEAAFPCLQYIVRTRFSAEHPSKNVSIGYVKLEELDLIIAEF